jgi:hypothetical protein
VCILVKLHALVPSTLVYLTLLMMLPYSMLSHTNCYTAITGTEAARLALEAKAKPAEDRTEADKKRIRGLFSSDGTGQDASAAGETTISDCISLLILACCSVALHHLVPRYAYSHE